jgi:hypothetical protein
VLNHVDVQPCPIATWESGNQVAGQFRCTTTKLNDALRVKRDQLVEQFKFVANFALGWWAMGHTEKSIDDAEW